MASGSNSESRVPNPATLPLLIEIGCEEIPARFLADSEKQLGERLLAALREARLCPDSRGDDSGSRNHNTNPRASSWSGASRSNSLETFSTPRRLVAFCPVLLAAQPDLIEEVTGPPVKISFDAQGKPTRAAQSFAEKNQANVQDLLQVKTAKGEYLAVKRTTRGRPTLEVLGEILPEVIAGMAFPKSMYWASKSGLHFVRPIRWILTALGEQGHSVSIPFVRSWIIRFAEADVQIGDTSRGHRTLKPGATETIQGFADYAEKLRKAGVEFDPQKRRERVQHGIRALLEVSGDRIIEDHDLEDWLVNSTEWPRALLGRFEERFLKLPREILITVMRDHQHYFAVENDRGRLEPCFITILNVDGDPSGLIRRGHERVLRARFSDAEFFWDADQKTPLRERLSMLEKVTYHVKLGTYARKIERMETIAKGLCNLLESQGSMDRAQTEHVMRAAQLSKCDLTTQMVQEFTELQGIVGGLYAAAQGEPREVAEAIYDHYLPQNIEARCPRTLIGAVVSLADKIDGLAAGFAAGEEPTGSSDPFGLRRQGNAIIKILVEFGISIPLRQFVEGPLNVAKSDAKNDDWHLFESLLRFLEERLRFYLEAAKKFRYDTIRAVIAPGWSDPVEAATRAQALEAVRRSEDFEALSAAAKRIKNILSKSASAKDWTAGEVAEEKLIELPEQELYNAYRSVASRFVALEASRRYQEAFQDMATLRPAVDRFFDKVLVMAEDRGLRQNRLRLLGKLDELFSKIAHLSDVASSGTNPEAGGMLNV